MKSRILTVIIVGSLLAGCDSYNAAKAKIVPLRGEWKVVNVNCLSVLAEKDGERMTFRYRLPAGNRITTEPEFTKEMMRVCQETVKPGWIIHVESKHRYAFFPPAKP